MNGGRSSRRPFATAACAVVALLLGACEEKVESPIAGLFAAGAPLYMLTKEGERPIAVGSQLRPSDRVRASGPAVLEYYGGALRFLDEGDTLEVGEVTEAKLIGANLNAKRVERGALVDLPPQRRIVAARYHSVQFTPKTKSAEPTTSDYFRAFFTPNGIENLGSGPAPEGPRRALPPPPHRQKVPHVHAGDLGPGGGQIRVGDGFVAAEAEDMATAILLEGEVYALGRTRRVVLPRGAEALVTLEDGAQVELEGPADVMLR